jgi:hypothetical protein
MPPFGVFMVFMALSSAEASSSVFDGFQSFGLGIQGVQGQLLTPIESVKSFSGIGQVIDQVAPDFNNDTNLLRAVSDFAWLISDLYGYQLNHFAGVSTEGCMVAPFAAVIVLAVGVYWLKTDRHFSRPTCAAFSMTFWLADLWVIVILCPMVGVGLGLFAYRMRGTFLLFPGTV